MFVDFSFKRRGSSPRVWGQAFDCGTHKSDRGIIPTRVGTSKNPFDVLDYYGDHPHACGDKCKSGMHFCKNPGSSPRVWGQDMNFKSRDGNDRIIPTRVGTSLRSTTAAVQVQDHPHACGDKLSHRVQAPPSDGSSPRVWGQAVVPPLCTFVRGIIPTRVGTSY